MEQKGQTQQALSDAQQAVALAPDNPNVHFSLGIIWLRVEQFDKAITEYKEALRLTTKEPTSLNKAKILNALASAYNAAGRLPEAIESAEKALDLALCCDNKELAESIEKQLTSLKSRPAVQKKH
jgi:tetratricopeptide (TPR) repeat protein